MTLRLPGEFFSPSSLYLSTDLSYITRLKKCMSHMRATVPQPSGASPSFIDNSLNHASHVFICRDSVWKPLQRPYDGPFRVISCSDKYFVLDLNGTRDTVSLDCLKPAHMEHLIPSFELPFVAPAPSTPVSPTAPTTHSGHQVRLPVHLAVEHMMFTFDDLKVNSHYD